VQGVKPTPTCSRINIVHRKYSAHHFRYQPPSYPFRYISLFPVNNNTKTLRKLVFSLTCVCVGVCLFFFVYEKGGGTRSFGSPPCQGDFVFGTPLGVVALVCLPVAEQLSLHVALPL